MYTAIRSILFWCLFLPFPARAAAEQPGAGEIQFLPNSLPSAFDLRVRLKTSAENLELRLVINWQSENNYYEIVMSPRGNQLLRHQEGVPLPMGWISSERVGTGTEVQLALKRRQTEMRLYLNGRLFAFAWDSCFRGGKLGLGSSDKALNVRAPLVQPVADLFFADDFMRAGENSPWTQISGVWKQKRLTNVSMSSNAFTFLGQAQKGAAMAATGSSFWDNYSAAVSVNPADGTALGIGAYFQDAQNLCLLRMAGKDGGTLQFVRMVKGKESVLSSCPLHYSTGHWYRLKLTLSTGKFHASVDGLELLSGSLPSGFEGRIVLYSESPEGHLFDDVRVQTNKAFEDDFSGPSEGPWLAIGGSWTHSHSLFRNVFPGNPCVSVQTRTPSKLLLQVLPPHSFRFQADTVSGETGEHGLCFWYRDEKNFWTATLSRQEARLTELSEGVMSQRGTFRGDFPPGLRNLALAIDGNSVRFFINGKPLLQTAVDTIPGGSLGLYTSRTEGTAFDNVRLESGKKLQPVFIQHEVFKSETTMANWAAAQSDWIQSNWQGKALSWNRGDFPGDGAIQVSLGKPAPAGAELFLVLNATDHNPEKGYSLSLSTKEKTHFLLSHGGTELARKDGVALSYPCVLSFQHRDGYLSVLTGAQVLLTAEVGERASGTQVGWAARDFNTKSENIELFSRQCRTYTFKNAPVDWIPAAGQWQVTNRWQCDPRWSFFSGRSTQLAALWCKYRFSGNVSIEFAAGPKMNRERGSYRNYASDLNVTICGDGKELTSGYSFIFGGWKNTTSRILKNNTVVAEDRKVLIPVANLHRRWLYLKAQRIGHRLQLFIDNKPVLTYDDPEPLPGDRAAIWTWNNGIMVARVRISADRILPPLPPEPYPSLWQMAPYNHPSQPGLLQTQWNRLKSGTPSDKALAAIELGKLRDPAAVPSLLPLLELDNDDCRWQAANALASIGLPGIEAMLEALDTPVKEVRWKIEAALRNSGPVAAPLIARTLIHGTAVQRQSCAYILRDIHAPETIPALIRAFSDKDEDVRWKAADSLVQHGAAAVEATVRAMRSENPRTRQTATWTLQQLGQTSPLGAFLGALGDADLEVRLKASTAILERKPFPATELIRYLPQAPSVAQDRILKILEEAKSPAVVQAQAIVSSRSRLGPGPRGRHVHESEQPVTVETVPAGASVFIDDHFAGVSPGQFRVRGKGPHLLALARAGHQTIFRKIELPRDQDNKVTLRPLAARSLVVRTVPPDAEIFLNGELKGRSPLTLTGLGPIKATVRAQLSGFLPAIETVSFDKESQRKLLLTLVSESEKFYLEALKKESKNASYRTELAHLYILRHDFSSAMKQLELAYDLVLTGQDASSYSSRLDWEIEKAYTAFYDIGDPQKVDVLRKELETLLARLTGKYPKAIQTWTLLSGIRKSMNKPDEAISTLGLGIKNVGKNWRLYYAMGIIQYEQATQGRKGFKARAIQSFTAALTLATSKSNRRPTQRYLKLAQKLP